MLKLFTEPYQLQITEHCGLNFERQVVEVPCPASVGEITALQDEISGELYPLQRSRAFPERAFLQIEIKPFQALKLRPARSPSAALGAVNVKTEGERALVGNDRLQVELAAGAGTGAADDGIMPGPITRVRMAGGPWRGRSFFDLRRGFSRWEGKFLESGPLRSKYHYRADAKTGEFFQLTLTLDAGSCFATVEEEFSGAAGDQLVWDLAGNDLPQAIYLLDTGAGYALRPLFYFFDQRLARLACWTQMTQLSDLSDGFALQFQDASDVLGMVSLEGGFWSGNRLNHIEAWVRRWDQAQPGTRRDVPPASKADAMPIPERIELRGRPTHAPHFNLEAWIGAGRRKWALVGSSRTGLLPGWDGVSDDERLAAAHNIGHFESSVDAEALRGKQGLLRRIQIQYGTMPLQHQLAITFDWPHEPAPSKDVFRYGTPAFDVQYAWSAARRAADEQTQQKQWWDYVCARVQGFWNGSGIAFTNPVASRGVAPSMLQYEWWAENGKLTSEQQRIARAMYVFLMHLFESDNYYPGLSTMLPVEHPESTEPTLEGMANQNFYTDVMNSIGMGAQVFHQHPRAQAWRGKFEGMWERQLQYHMYPESGIWEESHTYYHHVLHTVFPTFLRRRDDGLRDEFGSAPFQKLIAGVLKQVTPRDACYDGYRHVVVLGDHGADPAGYGYLYGEAANSIAPHDRKLAAELGWLHRESKGELPLKVEPAAPAWQHEAVQGLGFFFRSVDEAGTESLLALRCGSAWGHHHNDEGSLQFIARGRTLIADSAFSEVQAEYHKKHTDIGHSRWALRDFKSRNHLFRFNRGWIAACQTAGPLAYAVGYAPVYMYENEKEYSMLTPPAVHYRTIVQLGPTAFLIADTCPARLAQVVRFHVAGRQVERGENVCSATYNGQCVLRIASLSGATFAKTWTDAAERPRFSGAGDFSTTALEFGVGSAGRSIFLLTADATADGAPAISGGEAGGRVQLRGVDAEWEWAGDGSLVVRDLLRQASCRPSVSSPPSY